MLRFDGRIRTLQLEYDDKYLFDQSYIVIHYRFKNALWFKFGKHVTLEKQVKVFNLKHFDKEFDFIVYGFFRRKVFKFSFKPDHFLKTDEFKMAFRGLSFELNPPPELVIDCPQIKAAITPPLIDMVPIGIRKDKIKIETRTYNQSKFV